MEHVAHPLGTWSRSVQVGGGNPWAGQPQLSGSVHFIRHWAQVLGIA